MTRVEHEFVDYLKQRGFKVTQQRLAILEAVFGTHDHFSAEQLHRQLSETGTKVSLATVYRTVNVLVEGGFLEALDVGGGQLLYEHVLGHHHHDHLVCVGCGKIVEFVSDEIERLQEEEAKKKGFRITHHSLRIFGHCESCQEQGLSEDSDGPARIATSPST